MATRVAAYARVSTNLQATGLESQIRVLKEYLDFNKITNYEIFMDENVSGTKASRPGLDRMMQAVRNGEISNVIVPAFSRFARSTTHLLNALSEFKAKNVGFVSISEKIDTSTPVGIAIFSILAAVSQLERDLIAERVKIGLANARAKGKLIGRKKLRDSEMIRKLLAKKLTYRAIADLCACSHGSVHQELVALRREEAAAKEKTEKEQAERERLIAEQKSLEDRVNSSLQISTSDKIHFEVSSDDSKDG